MYVCMQANIYTIKAVQELLHTSQKAQKKNKIYIMEKNRAFFFLAGVIVGAAIHVRDALFTHFILPALEEKSD